MRRAIVIGSGAGGATAAKELQGRFDVTVVEAGREFRPFSRNLSFIEKLKKTGIMFDEREIQFLFPAMKIRKTEDRMVLVNGVGLGGTTTLATGNGVREDDGLKEIGINLDAEFTELSNEIPISIEHQKRWRKTTKRLFDICQMMGLQPRPLPKMGENRRCTNCGHCVLGCPNGAKWDARVFLNKALSDGAKLLTNCRAEKIIIRDGKASAAQVRRGRKRQFLEADLIVLAAGGFGTPIVLQESGLVCSERLFVDPVLCVAARWEGSLQNKEISMPFVVQKKGFILAPYFDYLSFFFNKEWKYPADDTLALMIKIADSNDGSISKREVRKTLNDHDRGKLIEGVGICYEIFDQLGAQKQDLFLGTVNAGHPGGMLPLTVNEAVSLHNDRLPENLYVADATLFPSSLGNPPMLTIMALAKRISKICIEKAA